jgi:hypothetical protein
MAMLVNGHADHDSLKHVCLTADDVLAYSRGLK